MFEEQFEFIEQNKEKESIEERNEKFSRIVKFLTKVGYFELFINIKKIKSKQLILPTFYFLTVLFLIFL